MINIVIEDYNENSHLNNYIDTIEEDTKYFIIFEQDVVSSIVSIKYLDWDSKVFNKKIGSFNICFGKLDKEISSIVMNKVNEICVEEKYECIFAKVSTDDYEIAHILEDSGYNLMDSIVTLKKKLTSDLKIKEDKHYEIKLLDKLDIPNVIEVIDNLYAYGRFFEDKNLDNEKVNELYKQWITNEIKNSSIDVIGIKENDKILGFISCKYQLFKENKIQGVISLVAIDRCYQGIGIGKKLMNSVLNNLRQKGIDEVYVGTQINNVQAINFYISNGFRINSSINSFHQWINNIN